MPRDIYSKAVMTVIAIALSVIALNPWIAPTKVEAAAFLGCFLSNLFRRGATVRESFPHRFPG